MKINKISLNNIFSYKNKVEFDFSKEKNIHLILGENGFGKTSFINSLKIALHGITRELLQIGETKLTIVEFIRGSKEKHFSGLLNRVAVKEGADSCSVSIEFTHKGQECKIVRAFRITNSYFDEALSVNIDDESEIKDDEAQDFINSIISPTLAKFFFFDGEKVQNIANFSNDEFRIMLEDVLELDVYDQLISDYTARKNEFIKEGIKDKDIREAFERTVAEIENKKNAIEEHTQAIKDANKQAKDVKKELTLLKNKITKYNSQYSEELNAANTTLSELKVEKEKKLLLFKKVSVSCLPLLLNKELGLKTEFDILNNYYDSNYIPIEVLKRKKTEFMEVVNEKLKNGEDIEEIFDSVFFSERKGIRVDFVDTSKVEFQYKSLDLDVIAFSALLDDLIILDEKIEAALKEIAGIQLAIKENAVTLDRLIQEQNEKTLDHNKFLSKIEFNDEQIAKNKENIELLQKEMNSLSMMEHKDNLLLASIETCDKIINTSMKVKEEIKSQKRAALEKIINAKFELLIKDSYTAKSLKISEDFSINVFDENEVAMDILSSSSGQKQIIATSLIWAIGEYINSDMPMTIDTPLGRLDDKNQKLLLEKFYSQVNTQIIMLPTPSELRAEGFESVQEQSSMYELSNNGSVATVKKIK